MSELFRTNLVLVAAPLPADFNGTPQDLYDAFVERVEIQSPVGTTFFVVGDVEPSTNVGPWLKGGTQWYVYNTDQRGYVPQDISAATASLFSSGTVLPGVPGVNDARVFLRSATDHVVGWYFYNTTLGWQPSANVSLSGATAQRPAAPVDFEQFFDTDINVLLHWERAAWRTVSGSPGDVKHVFTELLSAALTANPGWRYVGDLDQGFIGTVLGIAAKDSEVTKATDSGITARESGEVFGEETHVITSAEMEQHTHLVGTLTSLSNKQVYFYRVDNGQVADPNFLAPASDPPNYAKVQGDVGVAVNNATSTGDIPAAVTGGVLVTSKQLSMSSAASYTSAATGHNTVQPTLYLWCLTKD